MEKYTVVISGIEFNLLSDMSEEYVIGLAKLINSGIDTTMARKSQCSKLEAAIFTALNLLDDKVRIQRQLNEALNEKTALEKENEELKAKLNRLSNKLLKG